MKLHYSQRLRPSKNARYLAMDVSHSADHCIVLELRFLTRPGVPAGRMSMELLPHVDLRACLDLSVMATGRGGHPRIPGAGVTCNSGPLIKLEELSEIQVFNQGGPRGFKVRIQGLRLSAKPAAPRTRPVGGLLVDELGQSTRHGWSGKQSGPLLAGAAARPRVLVTQGKAGKRWRVVKAKGEFWLRTPQGERLFSIGSNCVRPFSGGPVKAMESLHDWIPPRRGVWGQAWMDEVRNGVSFYTANLIRRYGKDWQRLWARQAVARLQDWGFNTIGNWSHPLAWQPQGLYYTMNAEGWDEPRTEKGWGLYNGFPDVFSQAFEARCEQRARKVVRPDDPLLIGYFVLNEPPWQRENFHLAKLALETDRAPATRAALKAWLLKKYGKADARPTPEDLDNLRELMVDRYFTLTCGALRRHDPNHLLLGIRFYGVPPQFLLKAMRHMDVVSLNNYAAKPDPKILGALHKATGKPLMLGEFHMGAHGRGMHTGLVGVADQAERGIAYAHYMEQAAKIPYCVGAHWFQYVDQPVLGRFDGENYNIGLVDVTDRPYPELTAAAKDCNARLHAIHAGTQRPGARAPKLVPTGFAW